MLLRNFPLVCFICIFCFIIGGLAVELPCGVKRPGDRCVFDEECEGPNTRCLNQVCTCPELDFEDFHANNNTRVCRPAPRTVGAKCEKNCLPPLVCQSGQCVCWKAKQVGNQCTLDCPAGQIQLGQTCQSVSLSLGGDCASDSDCAAPFTVCDKQKCVCASGAQKTATGCVATCPDGSPPGGACRLKYITDRSLRSSVDQMDTCPRGQRCVTYGKPDIGQCCKAYCPYGQPDLTKSCKKSDVLQKPNIACPESTTHYCQIFDNSGASDRICCPRPCREPTPFYWNGMCLPFAHLDDPCGSDEECEGGVAMTCNGERCACRDGFTKQDSNPFPTCIRSDCNSVTQVMVQNQCLPKLLTWGSQCVNSKQCPTNMICTDGQCDCKCGFSYALGACYNPSDPLNVSPLLCGLTSIFQRTPDPRCVNMGSATSGTGTGSS